MTKRALFLDTNRGRSLSQMIADVLGTDTGTVHFLMVLGAIVYLGSRQK